MRSLILGTAGHIDHGKTELVRALTGVDTDRLKEEKERGITIDLGFAELPGDGVRLGVVDVPGHEGFVRNMLAGATGMDVVVMVVASDEGVMPQTREHLAIVSLLGVQKLVVALTKADLVEEAWLELVRDEVRELLAGTPYTQAPMVATSARTGQGIDELRALLLDQGSAADPGDPDDLAVLPLDRAFTVRGTGTVITGTLWSGRLKNGARVRLLPEGLTGRVRGLQVHGAEVDEALAGARTAVALTGDAMDLEHVQRGQTLVVDTRWPASQMLTVRFSLLPDTPWELAHNQRVRVHLGTAEVLARCVLFQDEPLKAGESGWGQLRLEEPATARARQPAVIRSYSPVMTMGGAQVVEPFPPKRRQVDADTVQAFRAILEGAPPAAVTAVAHLAGWAGAELDLLPVTTGLAPAPVAAAVPELEADGWLRTQQGRLVSRELAGRMRSAILERIDAMHRVEPFRPGVPVETLRDLAPTGAAAGVADDVLARLVAEGTIEVDRGVVARAGFRPTLSAEQEALYRRLADIYRAAGLEAVATSDLPDDVRKDPAFWPLLRRLEDEGQIVALDDGLFIGAAALQGAADAVRARLAGRQGLGPADFKEVVPVSRRHLLPILAWFDRTGVTRRDADGRSVDGGAANVSGTSSVLPE